MTKIKRKGLTVETKLEIIKAVEAGGKKANIGRQYGIPSSTLSTILKHRQSLISKFAASHFSPSRKRFRTAVRADVDEALASWCRDRLAKNLLVNGPILKGRAEQLAEEMGYEGFRASSGWLTRFKERYQIGLTRSRKKLPCRDLHESESNPDEALHPDQKPQNKEGALPQQKPTKEPICQVSQHKVKSPSKSDFSNTVFGPQPISQLCLSDKNPDKASAKQRVENRGKRPKNPTTETQDEPVNILSRLLQELSRGTAINAPEQEIDAQVQDGNRLPTSVVEISRLDKVKETEHATSSEAEPRPTTEDCINMIHNIQSYFGQRNDTPEKVVGATNSILEYLATCQDQDQQNGSHQRKITDFYLKKSTALSMQSKLQSPQ